MERSGVYNCACFLSHLLLTSPSFVLGPLQKNWAKMDEMAEMTIKGSFF